MYNDYMQVTIHRGVEMLSVYWLDIDSFGTKEIC